MTEEDRRDPAMPGRRYLDHCDAHLRNTATLDQNTSTLTAHAEKLVELRTTIIVVGAVISLVVTIGCGVVSWYVKSVADETNNIRLEQKDLRNEIKVSTELLIAGREKRIALEQRVDNLEEELSKRIHR